MPTFEQWRVEHPWQYRAAYVYSTTLAVFQTIWHVLTKGVRK